MPALSARAREGMLTSRNTRTRSPHIKVGPPVGVRGCCPIQSPRVVDSEAVKVMKCRLLRFLQIRSRDERERDGPGMAKLHISDTSNLSETLTPDSWLKTSQRKRKGVFLMLPLQQSRRMLRWQKPRYVTIMVVRELK